MDISNMEFRNYLLSRLVCEYTGVEWCMVSGKWGIEFVNGWGMKNNMGLVTIQYHDVVSNKVYSCTISSSYYDIICQEFRQGKIDLILSYQ